MLERLPHKPYEKPRVKVLCTCGNVVEMFSCNVVKKTQSFSCGNCQPYYKIEDNNLYMFLGKGGNGPVFVVDVEDFNLVLNKSWTIQEDTNNSYVRESSGSRVFLHRIITKCPDDLFVDHINGNGLDNRKVNLRVVSKSENAKNMRMTDKNSSGVLGVHFREDCGKWRAYIGSNGRKINLGSFKNKEDAIYARKQAEIFYNFHENHGRKFKGAIGKDL